MEETANMFLNCPIQINNKTVLSRFISFSFGIFITLLLVVSYLSIKTRQVNALESSDVQVISFSEYSIDYENTATVKIAINYVNVGDNPTILTSYTLNLGSIYLDELSVKASDTDVSYELEESNGVVLRLLLGDVLLRQEDQYVVEITYKLDDFFTQIGGTYEVFIPVFNNDSNSRTESIAVSYPESFGLINYSNIRCEQATENGYVNCEFVGLSEVDHLFMSVGEKKNYALSFEQNLTNDSESYVKKEIIIPPDLDTQKIVLNSITPYPEDAYISEFGDYVLVYTIAPKSDVWVRIMGTIIAKAPLKTRYFIQTDEKELFLDTEDEYVTLSDDTILQDLFGAEVDNLDSKTTWIYDYVIENLTLSRDFRNLHSYEYRKGANVALKTYKEASSEDYADSFVALCRALEIPSRQVYGYVFMFDSSEKDGMYHIWPQYWSDSFGWISVDPAYEEYSEYPMYESVGLGRVIIALNSENLGYQLSEVSSNIYPTDENVQPEAIMNAEIEMDDEIEVGISQTGRVVIENRGNTILSDVRLAQLPVEYELSELKISEDDIRIKEVILPGERIESDFDFKVEEFSFSGNKKLSLTAVAESPEGTVRQEINKDVKLVSVWWSEPMTWFVTVLLFTLVTGIGVSLMKFTMKIVNKIDKKGKK